MNSSEETTLFNKLRLLNIALKRGMNADCEHEKARVPSMSHVVLHYLYHCGGRALQKDVETEFNLRRSSASQLLGRLEQDGYIIRVTNESDGRSKRILITEKANDIHRQISDKFIEMEKHIESALTPDELQTFLVLCDKIIAQVEKPVKV